MNTSSAPQGDTYFVGTAVVDITPPIGCFLAGFTGRDDPSTRVYHPLRGTALAISDKHDAVLFLTVEWLGFYELTPRMRKLITDRVPIKPENIVLSGTHTHCGPSVRELDLARHGKIDEHYVTTALKRMAECAAQAWNTRRPAKLSVGVGTCDVAASRRRPNANGGVDWAPNLESPYDHEITVIAVDAPTGERRSVVFSYSCHPTCNFITEIGGDYVGFAVDAVEAARHGSTAMFLQACGGDQKVNARDEQTGGYRRLSIEEVRGVGERVAASVEQTLAGEMTPVTGPLRVRQVCFDIHAQPLDTALMDEYLPRDDNLGRWARHMKAQLDADGDIAATPFEVQGIAFGNSFAIATMSAEMVAEYALRLKHELRQRFTHALPIGYTNDIIGYVSSKRQIPEGGYEVVDSNFNYLRTGVFVDSTEDLIVSKVHEALTD